VKLMPRFSTAFGIDKSQGELDFVDVPLHTDMWLFVDPFAIGQRLDPWSQECRSTLTAFFQAVIDAIRTNRLNDAKELLAHLREPNETRFGLSKRKPDGAGIGTLQAQQLFDALTESSAVRTGILSSLEECELMIEGIGRDKISDLTTNVIRHHLIEYTARQCELHDVPVNSVPVAPCFDPNTLEWESRYAYLPVWKGKPIILVPKVIARYGTAYDHRRYYQHYVLNFLQAEALEAGSSLVRALKNGKRIVCKKDLKSSYPCTKDFLYRFSKDHPEVLVAYREDLARLEQSGKGTFVENGVEEIIAIALIEALRAIPPGNATASDYHRLMIGIIEFLFFPQLLNPKREKEIHQGRKRIDILVENGARDGIFYRLHDIRKLPCAFVPIECKNYTTEVANPELDQLGGRFSVNRGKCGLLCCRTFENRRLFIERCRDTLNDDRGLIIPLDDETILKLLEKVHQGSRREIDAILTEIVNEVWVSGVLITPVAQRRKGRESTRPRNAR
jgi:hypothetical protein